MELALENNITIRQNQLEYASAEIDKRTAFANFLPSINANANHSWNIGLNQNITTGLLENVTTQFSSAGINMGVDVYGGKHNFNQLHRAKLALLARQYQLADISDDISLLVANGYLQIMFNQEILGVQKAQLAVSNNDLKRTKELIASGVLTIADNLELEATIATQEQAVVQAENNLRLAKINLAQLLNITDYEDFAIEMIDVEVPFSRGMGESPKAIYVKSLSFRNDIKLADTNVEIAETDIALAKEYATPLKRILWIQHSFVLCRPFAWHRRVHRRSIWICAFYRRSGQHPCRRARGSSTTSYSRSIGLKRWA